MLARGRVLQRGCCELRRTGAAERLSLRSHLRCANSYAGRTKGSFRLFRLFGASLLADRLLRRRHFRERLWLNRLQRHGNRRTRRLAGRRPGAGLSHQSKNRLLYRRCYRCARFAAFSRWCIAYLRAGSRACDIQSPNRQRQAGKRRRLRWRRGRRCLRLGVFFWGFGAPRQCAVRGPGQYQRRFGQALARGRRDGKNLQSVRRRFLEV